jgi:hypothetical protein
VSHLSEKLRVGTGEIIDANSEPRQPRNQFDIVIYKADYPRIDLGGGINAFLSESVVATIEVKSVLTEVELDRAIANATAAKRLARNLVTSFHAGYVPPGILSYVVAYDGPAQIQTVYGWLKRSEQQRGLNQNNLPDPQQGRHSVLSESVEGVFLLGRGTIVFDNAPVSLVNDEVRQRIPDGKYQVLPQNSGNLLWLFLLLTSASSNSTAQWANLVPYLQRVQWQMHFMP